MIEPSPYSDSRLEDEPIPAELPPETEMTVRAFCARCGAQRTADEATCPACAAREQALARRPAAPTGRPVGPALALYFVLLASSLCGVLAAQAGANGLTVEMLITAIDTVVVLGWCFPARKVLAEPLRAVPRVRWFLAAFGAAAVTFAIASLSLAVLGKCLQVKSIDYTGPFFGAGYGWRAIILSVCVQPAVIEELAFRGIIFGALRRALTGPETAVVTALMFSILHLSIPSFPHLAVVGLALGFLRLKTGSIYPGMCLHFTHNLLCVLAEQKGW